MHYFDNAATTRVYPEASLRAAHTMNKLYGNPSSQHKMGREAADELSRARHAAANAIGAGDGSIIFTSGGTEADNQAVSSALHINRRTGQHIITSETEHPAVLEPIRAAVENGYEVTYLKPDKTGAVTPDALAAALRDDTALVSIMLVNNETGVVNPVAALAEVLKKRGSTALFHCDAVQGLFKVPIDIRALGVDFMSLSSHKVHGPKGAGALYVRPGLKALPLIRGGGQEEGFRSGTENMTSIAGFGVACHMGFERFSDNARQIIALRKYFEEKLAAAPVKAHINFTAGVPHIVSLCLEGCRSEVVTRMLGDLEIYVSSGSACAKGRRSHVLTACGLDSAVIDCTIRISFSEMNNEPDIDALINGLTAAYRRFHKKTND